MPSKDNMEPKRRKWYKFLSGHRAASPAPATAQSVDTGCSGQRHTEHGSNTPSVIAAQSCVPPPSSVADALGARPGAGTDMITSRSVPPVQPVEPTNEPAAAELAEQPRPAISVSERLWNIAYERLETADPELVGLYMKTLEKVLGGETGELCTADISAKLKDPTMRQKHMMELVQNGREKIFKASRITTGVGDVADFILSLKRMVDTVLQSVPQAAPAALPWAGVCLGLEILRNPAQATRSNLAGISHVISRMDWYCALSHHLLNRNKIAADDYEAVLRQLEERVVELYQALLLYQMKSVCSYYRNQGLVFLRGMFSLDDWDGDLGLVSNAEAAVQADAAQYSQELTKAYLAGLSDSAEEMEKRLGDIHQDIRDFISWQKDIRREDIESACRRDLRVIDPQNDMERIERSKDELLNDAFKWILRTPKFAAFTNWDDNGPECHARRLLWIKGHAGTGKTMLMIGLIRQLSCQPVTLAPGLSFFFCQGTDTTLNNATAVLRSLIWLLLYQQPYLVSHLIQKYKDSGTNLFTDKNAFIALSEAFRNMLKDAQLSPVYLAVDALDECTHGLRDLIRLIATSLTLSPKVKWLLSSRPEVINLLTELRGSGASFLNVSDGLLELDTQCLTEPVDAYIRHKLAGLRNRSGYNETVLAEVSDEVHARAGNTFLWVALAFKELDKAHGGYATQKIKGMPSGLTDLYGHMMDRIENGEMIDHEDCERALVAAYLAFRPLSLSELTVLAELQPDITKAAVEACGSFFTITGETVSLIHQSAKDFLEKNFTLKLQPDGVPQGHADISKRSVDAMSLLLKQNIYNIEPGCEPNDKTPPHLDPLASIRYSCEFWANHLLKGENPNKFLRELTDNGKLFVFLKEHLLHWLEALSLMGKTSDGILSIRKLLHAVQLQPNTAPGLMGFLKDAEKFMLSHRSVIERAPLQIYGSALVFSPTSSEVRKQYWKERLPFIRSTAGIRDGWGAQQQTLEGHNGWVTAIAFSPDGKVIASASYDYTIRLWDAATGVYQQTLEGHNDWVTAIAFSPDGKVIASASYDYTIRLWDAATGVYQQTLEGHNGSVKAIAFSPDGKVIASGSNETIRLWDAATGAYQQTLEGHNGSVNAIAFSPDGKVIASASDDCTIRLWDAATGTYQQTLEGHNDSVYAIAFSPDGKVIASASFDYTIRLWDAATGAHQQTLETSDIISTLSFSADSEYLETDKSIIKITSNSNLEASATLGVSGCPGVSDTSTNPSSDNIFFVDGDWIIGGGKKLLWLPLDYRRPSCVSVYDHTMVLGYHSGQLTLLQFSSKLK